MSFAKTPTPCPEPGIYHDIKEHIYRMWDAANASTLKLGVSKSPAHMRAALTYSRPPSPQMEFGTAVHFATMQPELFDQFYKVGPEGDGRTKEVKAAWARARENFPAATFLKADEYQRVMECRDAIRFDCEAGALFEDGTSEVSVVWDDETTGVRCKARVDWLREDGVVVDLKTAREGDPVGFSKACANFRYHLQSAYYLDGLRAAGADAMTWVWVAVETDPPYAVGVYECGSASLEQGRREYRRGLNLWAECKASEVWPGYTDGKGIQKLDIPRWAFDRRG